MTASLLQHLMHLRSPKSSTDNIPHLPCRPKFAERGLTFQQLTSLILITFRLLSAGVSEGTVGGRIANSLLHT